MMQLNEKIVWSSPPSLLGVVTLSAENSQRPWCVYHETYTIFNVNPLSKERGVSCGSSEAEWIYRRKSHYAVPESVNLIEPGELHRNTKTPPPNPFSALMIDPIMMNDIAAEAGMALNPHFKQAVTRDPFLYRSFVELHAVLEQETTLLHQQSAFVACIGALLRDHCEDRSQSVSDSSRRCLERARECLTEHFEQTITLNQLADIAGLSRYHFLRAFTREFGLTPHAYQLQIRIERVCRWLECGGIASEAATRAGFADLSHLIRHFKSALGVTPAQYIKAFR
jgi:AraC-like DNA-binding protein